ncbi:MAG TPA: histidine kinase, partial [Ilumatobacteraceae bacterium]
ALSEVLGGQAAAAGVMVAAAVLAADLGGGKFRHAVLVVCAGYVAVVWARKCAMAWRRRTAVRRLFAVYVRGRGLTESLREATGDADLQVTFPMAAGAGFVDVDGKPAHVDPGLTATDLRVHGEWLARVHHSPRVRLPDLDAALEPAAALMLDNERLTAQLAARVAEVDADRRAVVIVGLETRSALERDLHDGVQQELLALGLDIRLAIGLLPDHIPDRQLLQEALELVHDAVERVRVVSAGVAPPLLAIKGLSAAITALVRRTGASIQLGGLPWGPLPRDVEQAGYAVVAEAVARGATAVRATVHDDALEIAAEAAAPGADGVLPDLVAALGGTFDIVDGRMEAVIPCASSLQRINS